VVVSAFRTNRIIARSAIHSVLTPNYSLLTYYLTTNNNWSFI